MSTLGVTPTVLEICAGAGGQALGLETAGFEHVAAVEIEPIACTTLSLNRPSWRVIQGDVRGVSGSEFRGIDLLAGGVPCPPFSIAGKQLGADDERDLFPQALRLVEETSPAAVMLENVRGLSTDKFAFYRRTVIEKLNSLGYEVEWKVLNASDFDVPQLRPRFVLVGLRASLASNFRWPVGAQTRRTVGEVIGDLMTSRGWPGAAAWRQRANGIAPTLTGGSTKHGGPDLGPTRARRQWETLGVDGIAFAELPPGPDFPSDGLPRLTTRMVARLQGFPDDWLFAGKKTAVHRQIGNAFPPPVAAAVGSAIKRALMNEVVEARPGEQS